MCRILNGPEELSNGSRNWNRILWMFLFIHLNVFHSYNLIFYLFFHPFSTHFFSWMHRFAWMQLFCEKYSILKKILKQKKMEIHFVWIAILLPKVIYSFKKSILPILFYFHTHTKSNYYPELNKIASLQFFYGGGGNLTVNIISGVSLLLSVTINRSHMPSQPRHWLPFLCLSLYSTTKRSHEFTKN